MSETTLERWKRLKPHFTCPRCDATSWNPNDIAHLYCGRCHVFFEPPEVWPLPRNEPRRPNPRRVRRAEEALRPHHSSNSNAVAARHDDDVSNPFSSFSSDPAPSAAPDPPAFDPGGGSSGGGGASGDY